MQEESSSTLIYPNVKDNCKNVILIDNTVPDFLTFFNSSNDNTYPIVYSSNDSRESLITILRSKFQSIERLSIAFVNDSHNKLFLSNEMMLSNNNKDFIISLIKEFNVKNIDYLGCNTLQYNSWELYYDDLHKETNVIVGASNDRTGNLSLGGDWVMESTMEDIQNIYFTNEITNYSHLLDFGDHTVLIKNGLLYACGWNYYGQLGTNDTTDKKILTIMDNTNISGKMPIQVSNGSFHTVVLMSDGTLYACGYNNYGQLGTGINDTTTKMILTQMNTTNLAGKIPKIIACGTNHTVVATEDGSLFGCGFNGGSPSNPSSNVSVLGINNNADEYKTILTQMDNTNIVGKIPKSIACGDYHTVVAMIDGSLYACGSDFYGQIGRNHGDSKILVPMDTTNIVGKIPKSVSCGSHFTVVLMEDGSLFSCGHNGSGQSGLDTTYFAYILAPMITTNIVGKVPKKISCSNVRTVVLMSDGTLYACGYNNQGQLGTGINDTTDKRILTQMDTTNIVGKVPKSIHSQNYHTVVLMEDGSSYSCGYNLFGQLGSGINDTTTKRILTIMDNTNISMPITNICFVAGSLVKTDQGLVPIQDICIHKNTIDNDKILYLTNTKSKHNFLICIEKDSIMKNTPNKTTYLTKDHKILYKGKMTKAIDLIDKVAGVYKVQHNKESLYNILLEKGNKMEVNNLVSETLNPNHIIAKIYSQISSKQIQDYLIEENNYCVLNNDNIRYNILYGIINKYISNNEKI